MHHYHTPKGNASALRFFFQMKAGDRHDRDDSEAEETNDEDDENAVARASLLAAI